VKAALPEPAYPVRGGGGIAPPQAQPELVNQSPYIQTLSTYKVCGSPIYQICGCSPICQVCGSPIYQICGSPIPICQVCGSAAPPIYLGKRNATAYVKGICSGAHYLRILHLTRGASTYMSFLPHPS
jgi:hypothetical protein